MTKIFFIWNIQLVKNYGCFFSLYLWRFPFKNGFVLSPKIDDFEIEEPWKIWKLICMASNQKSESGTNCWLTGPVKSLAALSNEGKPENILLFRRYSSEGLGGQIRYWMVCLSQIINYSAHFPNISLLLSLRWRWRLKQRSEHRLNKALD